MISSVCLERSGIDDPFKESETYWVRAGDICARRLRSDTKHYRDAMGFSFKEIFGEPPSFAILKRDNMYVMVKQIEDQKHIVPRWTVSAGLWDMYFWVDDVDALYKEFVERGAKIDYGLCDQPYGCREFGTQDIDGHDIGFGQVIS